MRSGPASSQIGILLALIDEGFDKPAWHGPNLRGALRGLPASAAVWRPAPERPCIWQIALHCAYWKYAVRNRLTNGERRGSFPRRPSNWPALPERPGEAAWRADLALLDEQHRRLREAVAAFPPGRLGDAIKGRNTAARLIYGVAAHDLYHAGQVRLLIKLSGAK